MSSIRGELRPEVMLPLPPSGNCGRRRSGLNMRRGFSSVEIAYRFLSATAAEDAIGSVRFLGVLFIFLGGGRGSTPTEALSVVGFAADRSAPSESPFSPFLPLLFFPLARFFFGAPTPTDRGLSVRTPLTPSALASSSSSTPFSRRLFLPCEVVPEKGLPSSTRSSPSSAASLLFRPRFFPFLGATPPSARLALSTSLSRSRCFLPFFFFGTVPLSAKDSLLSTPFTRSRCFSPFFPGILPPTPPSSTSTPPARCFFALLFFLLLLLGYGRL
mmetsp:Transcript_18624/g.38966  ORF Transcript_18624/g.38966 Transcript_18624/m.38966 type:complete len:272 (+) Transcript_18624:4488-5303(+)